MFSMKRKLLISTGAVVGLLAGSAIAMAGSYETKPEELRQMVSQEAVFPLKTEKPTVVRPEEPAEHGTEEIAEPPIEEPEETEHRDAVYSMDWDAEESYLLAKIAMAEAEGEDTEGKALVICVVLNRTRSSKFPDGIEEVLYQKTQFSPIANGRFDRVEPDQDCWDALGMVEQGWDESQGALYFESESKSRWHRDHLQLLFRHGNHLFYTDKEE